MTLFLVLLEETLGVFVCLFFFVMYLLFSRFSYVFLCKMFYKKLAKVKCFTDSLYN